MNRIIWLDDDETAMKNVVYNIFPDLWKKDIKSEIYLFGDDVEGYYDKLKAVDNLKYSIFDTFISYLINEEIIEDELKTEEKSKLILNTDTVSDSNSNSNSDKSPIDVSIITDKRKADFENNNIISFWKSSENIKDITKSNVFEVDTIIKTIFDDSDIEDTDTYIMLDLCLLKGDYKKLTSDEKENCPLLSCALYNELSKSKDNKVFLYTTYVCPNDAVNKWINIYKSMYTDSKVDSIKIFNRNGYCINPQDNKTNTFAEFIWRKKDE